MKYDWNTIKMWTYGPVLSSNKRYVWRIKEISGEFVILGGGKKDVLIAGPFPTLEAAKAAFKVLFD